MSDANTAPTQDTSKETFTAYYACRALCGEMDEHRIALYLPLMMRAYRIGASQAGADDPLSMPHQWELIPTLDANAGARKTWQCLNCNQQAMTDGPEPPAPTGECCQKIDAATLAEGWARANQRNRQLSNELAERRRQIDPESAAHWDAMRKQRDAAMIAFETEKKRAEEAVWSAAACLSIAEGAPGWDQPIEKEDEAMRAVRRLRENWVKANHDLLVAQDQLTAELLAQQAR